MSACECGRSSGRILLFRAVAQKNLVLAVPVAKMGGEGATKRMWHTYANRYHDMMDEAIYTNKIDRDIRYEVKSAGTTILHVADTLCNVVVISFFLSPYRESIIITNKGERNGTMEIPSVSSISKSHHR